MQDLFGEPIELLVKHGKASAALGTNKPAQHSPRVAPTASERPPSVATPPPESEPLADNTDEIPVDMPLRQVVERYLSEHALPYVDVQKAQQCLFSVSRLQPFDFAVADGDLTWLLYAGDISDCARDDLREWERIFGPGFNALVADKVEDYENDTFTLAFRTLNGDKVDLK